MSLASDDDQATLFVRALIAYCRNERKRQKLSQKVVAERMGANQPAVAKLESFRHEPNLSTALSYFAAVPGVLERLVGIALEVAMSRQKDEPLDNSVKRTGIDWPRHTTSYIVKWIKDERSRQSLTLEGLAELTGVSRSLLGAIESGSREPPLDVLSACLYALSREEGDRFILGFNEIASRIRPAAVERETKAFVKNLLQPG